MAVLKFFILDLGKGVESEISIGDIVDVENFKNAAGALIEGIAITRKKCCLLLLLLGKLRLEADVWQPVALCQTDLRNLFILSVIELTKQSFLNLVDILDIHVFLLFFDFNQL